MTATTTEPATDLMSAQAQALAAQPSEAILPVSPLQLPGPLILPEASESLAATSAPTGRGEVVFDRIRKGLGPNSCASGGDRWRQRYAGNPRAFARHLEQVLPLLDFVSAEVERTGLPAEFVFIPLVESWYRPEAIGAGGPAGMWQMIGSTARNHGVHIKPGYDGRLSPVESTRAALSYLKTLQGMFGGWQTIVMAYNAGEGRIINAFKRSRTRDVSGINRQPHGLSNVTYDYVSKLQALSCLIAEPGRSGLSLPLEARFVPLAPILMDAGLDSLDLFAARQRQDRQLLRRLNPGYKGGRVIDGVPRLVLTPIGIGQASAADLVLASNAPAEPAEQDATGQRGRQHHRVHAGESLSSIAKLYDVTIDQLRRLNRLGRKSIVRPGQTLRLVP